MALHVLQDGKIEPLKPKGGDDSTCAEQEPAETGTGKPDPETEPTEMRAKTPETPNRDWVEEAYKCFVKDAKDIDPTDPVKAIKAYFAKNASDELKARCKAEGKDAKGCWRFVEAVARKALNGSSGHIDPAVVYAIAMHWFEDVPADWSKTAKARPSGQKKPAAKSTRREELEDKIAQGQSEPVRQKAKKRKSKTQQGFFFELLETGPRKQDGEPSPDEETVAPAEENVVEQRSEAAEPTESEVQK